MKYHLQTLAETGARWSDFGPYVPCLSPTGAVAFQATLPAGGSGLYLAQANAVHCLFESDLGPFSHFYSHPDLNQSQALCFYAVLPNRVAGVYLSEGKQLTPLAETGKTFEEIGPLGPTLNTHGEVAFRANLKNGQVGIFKASAQHGLSEIAKTGECFSGFQGLPVIKASGEVLFRADLNNGKAGLFYWHGGKITPLILTGERFSQLGAFPDWSAEGQVVFAAMLHSGESGIFRLQADQPSQTLKQIFSIESGFSHFRGALVNDAGKIIFFATPKGGQLGLFTGPDPVQNKLLGIGDSWQAAKVTEKVAEKVTEFTLNAVSFNQQGQIALRVKLSNGQGLILRADPA
ncbi:MAG: choice-of-anchor tandem repeat NxxGxxAF-containing protein [Candidatus Sericytochromatia bacterium]